MNKSRTTLLITAPYWMGIAADALWAVGLLFPRVYGVLTGRPAFNPDLQSRLAMGVGGTLMTGWTCLLVWAVRKPIERRFVILLTAFPVVFGLFLVALVGVLRGNTFGIWILVKTFILFVSMIAGYVAAGRVARRSD